MNTVFIIFQWLVPQHLLSRLVGYLAKSELIWLKNTLIKAFIKHYNVDMSLADKQQPYDFLSFNDFFTRCLKDGVRPIDATADSIVSPADGCISEIGRIHSNRLLQAKGINYQAHELLGSATDAKAFENGLFATVYLSPKDYHRVHMPLTGKLIKTRYIPGQLFSVNQTTAEGVDNLFSRNERLVCLFETEHGLMSVIFVGAMIVAGISTVWQPDLGPAPFTVLETLLEEPLHFNKGDELGRFYLGSTAIVLLPENSAEWLEPLQNGSTVMMGQKIGVVS